MRNSIAQTLQDFKPYSDGKFERSSGINKIPFEGKEHKVRKDKRLKSEKLPAAFEQKRYLKKDR